MTPTHNNSIIITITIPKIISTNLRTFSFFPITVYYCTTNVSICGEKPSKSLKTKTGKSQWGGGGGGFTTLGEGDDLNQTEKTLYI